MMTQKKQRPEIVNTLLDTIQNNGRLFTVFSIALILLSGLAIIEQKADWWIIALGIIGTFAMVFIFMNARIIIKIGIVSILNILMSVAAFQVGSATDSEGIGGLIWMSSVFFTFFILLAMSYLLVSNKSRWNAIGFSTVFGFLLTYALSVLGFDTTLASITGIFVSGIAFTLMFKLGVKNRYKLSDMPTNILTPDMEKNLLQGFKKWGWNATSLKDKGGDSGGILAWEDKSYLLFPIDMDESFTSLETRRSSMLGYKEKNITPWLFDIVSTQLPVWRARNANISLILLDINHKNGKKPRVIGVSVPDSKKKIPVGIIPAKAAQTGSLEGIDAIITAIDSEMSLYTKPLKDKQKTALSRIGKDIPTKKEQKKKRAILDPANLQKRRATMKKNI